MNLATNNQKDKIFVEADVKDINQRIIFNIEIDDELDVVFSKETVQNGIIQYLSMGLFHREPYKAEIKSIVDFQGKQPPVKQLFIHSDNEFYYKAQWPRIKGIIKAFATEAKKEEFKNKIVEGFLSSLKLDIINERLTMLLTNKIRQYSDNTVDLIGRNDIAKEQTFDIDKTITVDMTSKDKIINSLKELKIFLRKYKTPKKHTKFAIDNGEMRDIRTFKTNDFYWILNTKYIPEINVATANQYHNTDLLVQGVKKQLDYDFEDFEGHNKLTVAQKAAAGKTVGFFVHKNALVNVMPGPISISELQLTKFLVHLELLAQFGYGRIVQYPIVKVVVA